MAGVVVQPAAVARHIRVARFVEVFPIVAVIRARVPDVVVAGHDAVEHARVVENLLHRGGKRVLLARRFGAVRLVDKVAGVQRVADLARRVSLGRVAHDRFIQKVQILVARIILRVGVPEHRVAAVGDGRRHRRDAHLPSSE